jgi:hypothetical protein
MAEEKEGWKIPALTRDNHESWFRRYKIKLTGKDIYYVCEKTYIEYCKVATVGEITDLLEELDISDAQNNNKTIRLNIERKAKYLKDEATALDLMFRSLSEDDQALFDEYSRTYDFWAYLHKKYSKTDATTANMYMTNIQTFTFGEDSTIVGSWDKLKDYRRKLGAADVNAKTAYNDAALLLVLIRSLPKSFETTIDTLNAQSSLTVDDKLKHLEEKESRMKVDTEQAHAARARPYVIPHRRDSTSERSVSPRSNCYLCDGKHWMRNCPEIERARKLIKRDNKERQRKRTQKAQPKTSNKLVKYVPKTTPKPTSKPTRKNAHGYVADDDFTSQTEESLSESDTQEDDEEEEVCRLSKEEISKATPSTWPADTGATSHMSDQPSLFSTMKPIKARRVKVGGGELLAKHKGSARLQCADGSSMILKDVLYVPRLGINLISARKLCQEGLKGSFDKNHMYFKQGTKKVVTATMTNGLYVITHVSKKCKDTAFAGVETRENTTPTATDDGSDNEATKEKELERYLKYHQRFAHLGPNKIRNLHKVTTLQKKIKIPKDLDICDVCAITKMRNKIPKQLSVWPTTILDLIQFDVAGPLPATIRGNRWFLLIIDICSRRDWVLPLKHKGDAYQALKEWKVKVERQTDKRIRRARSDNAPELLKAIDDWRVEDGVLAQSTTVASSHQNGPAERTIQTVEFDMRAMLEEAQLPIEFWDEAAEADSYMRNHTDTGPVIDGQKTCPLKAFTGETPSIDHIRKWGSKCFYYVDKKTIPANERHDKLVNPGRVGVFMGYSENTIKHFKVYSPERGYTIMSSRVLIKESVKGGTIDLRIRNCAAGPQGTPNAAFDRKPRGRPKGAKKAELTPTTTSTTPRVVIPAFTPPKNVPTFAEEDMPDYELPPKSPAITVDQTAQNAATIQNQLVDQTIQNQPGDQAVHKTAYHAESVQSQPVTQTAHQSTSQSAHHVTTERKPYQATIEDADEEMTYSEKPQNPPTATPEPVAAPNITEPAEQPRYFTRSARKRAGSETAEDQGNAKRVRAMIAQIISGMDKDELDLDEPKDLLSNDFETAFPAEVIAGIHIPRTYKEAINDPKHAEQWRAAMAEEMLSLHANGTFQEVIPPKGSNLVSCKWVFTVKTTPNGSLERFKARLVARGFSQVHGQDYDQTFAPTVRMDTLRLFLATVAAEDLECSQYDIKNAFTESHLKEEIYLEPPKGISLRKGYVWRALRSLYGLKQAARDWNKLIRKELVRWGFVQSLADPCMFIHSKNSVKLLVYVDDIVAAAKKQGELDWFYETLSERFNAKNLGEISKILGARITRDRKNRTLDIDQEQYLKSVLDKFGITQETHKPKAIPAVGYENLRLANDSDERINVTEYQQAIGSVMYAMIFTRPDIAFTLGKLSQFMSDPAKHHGHALKSLFRYLKSTVSTRIRYGPGGVHKQFVLYSDSDWASDKVDRKSISGSVTMFYGGPISWSSKKQRSVATSSCEAEYIALATCAKQGQWIAQVFRDLQLAKYIGRNPRLVQMLGDNQGAIALTENAHLNERSKHVDICYHFIRDLAEKGDLRVDYIPTAEMVADGMTKPLARVAFERFKGQMGLVEKRREKRRSLEE